MIRSEKESNMKKLAILLCVCFLVGVFAMGALAQPMGKRSASEGWPMGRMYNPNTVEKLDGKIESIEKVTAGRMDIPARVLLKLKTSKGTETIYLGPDWYLEKQDLKLSPGDYIQVRGSRITMGDKVVILPNEIIKNSKKAIFWDDQGRPSWRGQGPRSRQ
jgi:hypothetical protein